MAADRLSTTSYALLGLLSRRSIPVSGYDLNAFAERTIGYFWPLSRSAIYKELSRLEALGYVSGSAVVQARLPDKRLFELTEAGTSVLDQGLVESDFSAQRPRDGFLLKLFLAHRLPPQAFAQLLDDFRARCEADLVDMTALSARLSTQPESKFGWLAARYGAEQAQARLRWLDAIGDVAVGLSDQRMSTSKTHP